MSCIKCNSERIMSIQAHCSDLFCMDYKGKELISSGYVPYEIGIGGGDDVILDICADCGQVQGEYPIKEELFQIIKGENAGVIL